MSDAHRGVRPVACTRVAIAFAGLAFASPLASQPITIDGMIFDAVTGRPVAGAEVSAVAGGRVLARAATGPLGQFELSVEGPGPVNLRVTREGYRDGGLSGLELGGGAVSNLLIELEPLGPVEVAAIGGPGSGPARVLGRVRDADTDRPVTGVEVRIEGETRSVRTVTDGNGFYTFAEVPPGTPRLVVESLGYGTQERDVPLAPGGSYRIDVRIRPEALEIAGFEVEAMTRGTFDRWDGLYWRISRDLGGHFILAEELETRGYPPLVTALTSLPSVDIRTFVEGPANARAIDPFNQRIFLRNCKASIWLDGIEVFNPADDDKPAPPHLGEFLRVRTADLEAIEVYPGAATLPPEFNNPGTRCAVVIWTKRGNE